MTTVHIDGKDPTLLAVSFPEDPIGNNLVRQIPGRRWSYRIDGPIPSVLARTQYPRGCCANWEIIWQRLLPVR